MMKRMAFMTLIILVLALGVDVVWAHPQAAQSCCGTCGGSAKVKAKTPACTTPSCAKLKACCGTCGDPAKAKACASGCTKPCAKGLVCPANLLKKAKALGLSLQQTTKLEYIMAEARAKALAVLTPAQVRVLTQAGKACGSSCAKPCCAKPKACCHSSGCGPKKACCPSSGCDQKKVCTTGCAKPKPCGPSSSCGQKKACGTGGTKPCSADKVTEKQKLCPVMGLPVNKKLSTTYQGKKVYLCCPSCVKKFNANPEKYVSQLPQFKQ